MALILPLRPAYDRVNKPRTYARWKLLARRATRGGTLILRALFEETCSIAEAELRAASGNEKLGAISAGEVGSVCADAPNHGMNCRLPEGVMAISKARTSRTS